MNVRVTKVLPKLFLVLIKIPLLLVCSYVIVNPSSLMSSPNYVAQQDVVSKSVTGQVQLSFLDMNGGNSTSISCNGNGSVLINLGGTPSEKAYYELRKSSLGDRLNALIITSNDVLNYNYAHELLNGIRIPTIVLVGRRSDYRLVEFINWLKEQEKTGTRVYTIGESYSDISRNGFEWLTCEGTNFWISLNNKNNGEDFLSASVVAKTQDFSVLIVDVFSNDLQVPTNVLDKVNIIKIGLIPDKINTVTWELLDKLNKVNVAIFNGVNSIQNSDKNDLEDGILLLSGRVEKGALLHDITLRRGKNKGNNLKDYHFGVEHHVYSLFDSGNIKIKYQNGNRTLATEYLK